MRPLLVQTLSGTRPILCVITDTGIQKKFSHLDLAGMAVRGGAGWIQFRDKKMATRHLVETAGALCRLCRKAGVVFIVNDRVDAALMADADGVHLGREDLPVPEARRILGSGKIIGATAANPREALRLEKEGADYLGFGHIFPTSSKKKRSPPQGTAALKAVCESVKIPVFAVGGINPANAAEVLEAGARGIAVVEAVCGSANPEEAARELKSKLETFSNNNDVKSGKLFSKSAKRLSETRVGNVPKRGRRPS